MQTKFKYIYPFIYDSKYLSSLLSNETTKQKIKEVSYKDNFLNVLDRMFKGDLKEKIRKLDVLEYYDKKSDRKYFITDMKKSYEIQINAEIYFFPEEIAFLVLEIEPKEKNIDDLYYLNSLLVGFNKQEKNSVFIFSDSLTISPKSDKKIVIKDEKIQKLIQLDCKKVIDIIEEYNENYIKLKPIIIKNELYDRKKYKRLGLYKDEKEKILSDENNKIIEENTDLMYSTYKVIFHQLKPEQSKEKKYRAIYYDIFITSFFVEFAKLNNKMEYYDNFNPLGINYFSLYSSFEIDNLNKEYDNNFANFEPFLHNKKNRGTIKKVDFFDIFQTQADWFIIANENNLINLVNKNIYSKVSSIIENQRFLAYLFILFQNVYLNMAHNTINTISSKSFFKKIIFFDKTMNQYMNFLNNYNLIDISDEPSLNRFYKFLRNVKNLKEKLEYLRNIFFHNNSFKSIFENLVGNKVILIILILLTPIFVKLYSDFSDFIILEYIEPYFKHLLKE